MSPADEDPETGAGDDDLDLAGAKRDLSSNDICLISNHNLPGVAPGFQS